MRFSASRRLLTAAAMTVVLAAAGCAQAPLGTQVQLAGAEENGFEALSKPINQEAQAVARSWQRDAIQMGVMINRSPKGVQDTATFVFSSRTKKSRMLLVIAASKGLEGQEIAVNDRTAEGLANSLPLTKAHGELMNSKKLFKLAEAAGLKGAEDVVVVNAAQKGGSTPVAIVTDESGHGYIVLNAVTGEPLTPVSKAGARKVQVHILIIGGVILAVAVGAAVMWGVKKWRERHDNNKPTPKPSAVPSGQPTLNPTPVPSATPVPTPVPTSKPAGPIADILAGPFGGVFDRLDKDKDNKLTLAEYILPATDDATMRLKTNEYREFLDSSHKNAIAKNEFLAGIGRSVTSKCGISFSMLDSNQDRGLDMKELEGNISNGNDFAAADTNNDGKLSEREYLAPFAKSEGMYANYYGK